MLGPWSWTTRGFRCALLCLALGVAPVAAQPPDAAARWRALNAETLEAYRRGAYAEGTVTAERALALARELLGQAFAHDAMAALALLQHVKAAGANGANGGGGPRQ